MQKHPNQDEVLYIVEGSGEVTFELKEKLDHECWRPCVCRLISITAIKRGRTGA